MSATTSSDFMASSLDGSPRAHAMFLRTLPAIRTRCAQVFDRAEKGALQFFEYDPARLDEVIEFCASIIERDFGKAFDTIPPHGRWRHLDAGRPRIAPLLETWTAAGVCTSEQCKRLLDLSLVSVLLDAGAGSAWTYTEPGNDTQANTFARSEGLGVASLHMFCAGMFSGDSEQPCRVDARGLARITTDDVAEAMQVGATNPMVGLEGRSALLVRLGGALASHPEFFGEEARPGNMLDFLETQSTLDSATGTRHVPIAALWTALVDGLSDIWPSRHTLGGVPLGDVWPCPALAADAGANADADANVDAIAHTLVPFHKLTGWIAYSLVEPIERLMRWSVDGLADMTGLPEYRNGGLLVDLGVLKLRPGVLGPEYYPGTEMGADANAIPRLPPSHPAIVEWRAMTVIQLDRIAEELRRKFGLTPQQLTLAQVLESATWKGGREIARQKRPQTGGPPIDIISDGTVF